MKETESLSNSKRKGVFKRMTHVPGVPDVVTAARSETRGGKPQEANVPISTQRHAPCDTARTMARSTRIFVCRGHPCHDSAFGDRRTSLEVQKRLDKATPSALSRNIPSAPTVSFAGVVPDR